MPDLLVYNSVWFSEANDLRWLLWGQGFEGSAVRTGICDGCYEDSDGCYEDKVVHLKNKQNWRENSCRCVAGCLHSNVKSSIMHAPQHKTNRRENSCRCVAGCLHSNVKSSIMHAPQHKTKLKREFLQVRGRLCAQQGESSIMHDTCISAHNKNGRGTDVYQRLIVWRLPVPWPCNSYCWPIPWPCNSCPDRPLWHCWPVPWPCSSCPDLDPINLARTDFCDTADPYLDLVILTADPYLDPVILAWTDLCDTADPYLDLVVLARTLTL